MYIIQVSNAVAEDWYTGCGWYWMDEMANLHGPILEEHQAVEHYAWYWKDYLDKLRERGMIQ
jgi:hypothetical protein